MGMKMKLVFRHFIVCDGCKSHSNLLNNLMILKECFASHVHYIYYYSIKNLISIQMVEAIKNQNHSVKLKMGKKNSKIHFQRAVIL